MYTLKVAYGDVDDEPEMATTEILGTYGGKKISIKPLA